MSVQFSEDCSICLDSLPKLAYNFVRMTCCGKGLHEKCYENIFKSSMSDKQKNQCIMCRTVSAKSAEEQTERIRRWADKGKAWAQSMLGREYADGEDVEQSDQQAAELYGLAERQGYAVAQFNLGNFYREGQGVDQSNERAAEYYEAAARQGHSNAQYNLGLMYSQGQGVDQNDKKAAEYYEAAARQGHAGAQFNLGAAYHNGQGVEQSGETAREWCMKSAEQGVEQAIEGLQILDKHEGRTTPSFTPPKRCSACDTPKTSTHKLRNCKCKAAQYCNAACQKKHWKSHKKEHRRLCKETELTNTEGEMKDEVAEGGEVVVEEEEEGETKETTTAESQQQEEEDVCPVCMEPVQKDTNKFNRMTCCGKGMHKWCYKEIYASSLSHEQQNSCPLCRTKYPMSGGGTSVEQVRLWVEKGKAWAQTMLGYRYRDGVGVDQSYEQARELFELSASQGEVAAQYSLGCMYKDGQSVDQSYERAREYHETAARQGFSHSQYNLGALYCHGEGVERSYETARELWLKAAAQGHELAIKGLQKLDKHEGRTTPSFIPKPIECANCFRPHDPPEHKLNACNRCRRVFYCGRECQVIHWNKEGGHRSYGHKQVCNKL